MKTWSFSGLKTYEQCPRKYYHLKVAGDVKDAPGTAALYGGDVHTAAEMRVKNGTAIPEKYAYMTPIVENLLALPGDKHAELELGLQRTEEGYSPCSFHDPKAYYRGIADLLIIKGDNGICVDYKTGKNMRYADPRQLDLLAGAVFHHFPQVKKLRSSLLFVVLDKQIEKIHYADRVDDYLSVFNQSLDRLEKSFEYDVWNPKDGPLCGYCPVKSCEYWRKPRS